MQTGRAFFFQGRLPVLLVLMILPAFLFNTIPVYSQPPEVYEKDGNGRYDKTVLERDKSLFIEQNGDLPVSEIKINGLRKTDRNVILNLAGVKPGDMLSSFDPHELVNRLKMKNIFSDIHIDYLNASGNAVIEISVREKWTLIPLPMFSSNDKNTSVGMYLFDSNFLGYAKVLFAGGTYSNAGWSGIAGYIDPAIAGTGLRGSLFLIYKNFIFEDGDMRDNIYREYHSQEKRIKISAGYGINSRYLFYLTGGYSSAEIYRDYPDSYNLPGDSKTIDTGLNARINLLKYYEYMYFGLLMEAEILRHTAVDSTEDYNTAKYKFSYSHKFFSFHRFTISSEGGTGDRPDIMEERPGGKPGFRTLPADIITADTFISGTATYEFPFLKFSWGAATLQGFWEQGMLNRDNGKFSGFYGPGCGMVFYLKRLAIPALGLNLARNVKTGRSEFSVSAGFSF